jgi:hypothetical protein
MKGRKHLSLMSKASRTAMQSKGLKRFDTCSCHPCAWGLKKGLRRARRRYDRLAIREQMDD